MKRALILALCLASVVVAKAGNNEDLSQKDVANKEQQIKLYGFVRNYYYYDSRKCLQSSGGLFNQIPMDESFNLVDEDLNDIPSSRLLAITTRIGLDFSGPDILGAKSSAKIESDFNGFSSSTTMLRIRQAYFKLKWEQQSILFGQTWHPFSKNLPDVLALASGSPFTPFNRSPQLRYDFATTSNITLTAAAIFQFQYTSVGPNGASADYSKNSILPELLANISFTKNGFTAGTGIDYLRIRPRTTGTKVVENETIETLVNDYVAGITSSTFLGYTKDKFSAKAQCTYGQNVSHLNMMSGYGVTQKNDNGSFNYATLNSVTSWISISYGKKYKASLFLGHMENLGSNEDFTSQADVYVRGYKNIGNMFRVVPSISYNIAKFNTGIEYEMTTVGYGESVDSKGKVSNLHNVTNNRICFMARYNF